jgi:16S rRNA (guanine527-N7)-methyltransferase
MMADRKLSLADEFDKALEHHAAEYGFRPGDEERARLREYFSLVMAWNPRLHLVAPCPPEEFATRHVLESMLALRFLPEGARVLDVGSGAGLPIIPCLIARPGLSAFLIEASKKKSVFLREALSRLDRQRDARVIAERFEQVEPPEADFLTCRALERFGEMFDSLVSWAPKRCTCLFFAGPSLGEQIGRRTSDFTVVHLPRSRQRFLYVFTAGDATAQV